MVFYDEPPGQVKCEGPYHLFWCSVTIESIPKNVPPTLMISLCFQFRTFHILQFSIKGTLSPSAANKDDPAGVTNDSHCSLYH